MSYYSKAQREEQERQRRSRTIRRVVLACACALVAVVGLSVFYLAGQPKTVRAQWNGEGDLTVSRSKLSNELTYMRVPGFAEDMLVWVDGEGQARTAFDACATCYGSGNATYTHSGSVLTCRNCGETVFLSSLGLAEWGGCQPVAIPADFRTDTQEEIVIPAAVMVYAGTMFDTWNTGDYSMTLASYGEAV